MASHFAFEAIGTHWNIDIYEDLSVDQEGFLLSTIRNRIELFEQTYSRFRKDSLVTEMAIKAGKYELPEDAKVLLSFYRDLYIATEGLVTPLIGNVLVDAGYDQTYSLQQKKTLAEAPVWDDVMEYNYPVLEVKKPTQLDFGALGKGYLIDIIGVLIENNNITHYCVDAGGDMIQRNIAPLRVGLEHPTDPTQIIGIVELQNRSLCGSAGNRRRWQNFHHIIDPKKLLSPEHILAVWVIADTTILADALTTCLFFLPADKLKQYPFEYCLVHHDFSIEKSAGFILEG